MMIHGFDSFDGSAAMVLVVMFAGMVLGGVLVGAVMAYHRWGEISDLRAECARQKMKIQAFIQQGYRVVPETHTNN